MTPAEKDKRREAWLASVLGDSPDWGWSIVRHAGLDSLLDERDRLHEMVRVARDELTLLSESLRYSGKNGPQKALAKMKEIEGER